MEQISQDQDLTKEETQKLWSRYYGRNLTEQEALEVKKNILNMIELLKEIDQN